MASDIVADSSASSRISDGTAIRAIRSPPGVLSSNSRSPRRPHGTAWRP